MPFGHRRHNVRSVNATAWRRLLDVDAIEQVIERTLVDQPRDVAFDRRFRNPKRRGVEALVKHKYPRAVRDQDLGRGPTTAEEHEQRTRARLAPEALGDHTA